MNGNMIRIVRILRGISQRELGDRVGCSDVLIAYMENGKRSVTPSMDARIRSELGLTDDDIRELNELSRSVSRGVILGNIPRNEK
jgi:transcriptional regulator with XRE-family HTH domain